MYNYYLFYKPYNILSQFTDEGNKQGYGSLITIPKDVYNVGRLDSDSEGLMILTNDKSLNQLLLQPKNAHKRTYYVLVEGVVTEKAIQQLREGVSITIDGQSYDTRRADGRIIDTPELPERNPPVRFRKTVTDTWIELKLTEGKNRQVRKMTAAVGFPTLRLVRVAIGGITMDDPTPGKLVELTRNFIIQNMDV
jgi:23S rRNA pseudouridine2457 synthase